MSSQCSCGMSPDVPKPVEKKNYALLKDAYNIQGKKYQKGRKKFTVFEMVLIIIMIIIFYFLVIKEMKLC